MKVLFVVATLVFLWTVPILAEAVPLKDIAVEHQYKRMKSGIYGWDSKYDISFKNQDLLVDIDIKLAGSDPGQSLLDQWTDGIKQIWSNAFDIFDGTYRYDTVFKVDWVTTGQDYTVNVHAGTGRSNMTHWYTDKPAGRARKVAAHEYGHMLGLCDEYVGGAVDPLTNLIRDNSIMGQNLENPFEDHYDPFLDWLTGKTNRPLTLVGDTGTHDYPQQPAPVPEPSTWLLLSSGLASLAWYGRKRKKI